MTLTRRQASALLSEHGLSPRRALGQNFVVDPNTVRRIARLSGVGPGDYVLEIGPGLGALTLALAETGASVTAVEADRHLMPALEQVVGDQPVRLVHGDARRQPWSELLGDADRWTLVANLPYNLAAPLILDLLAGVPAITRMLVMVQAEVADRLAAAPGDPAGGIPSVKVAYHAHARVVGRVSPEVFLPRPRVGSKLVELTRLAAPAVDADPGTLFTLVEAGFGQRRKMLRRALAAHLSTEAIVAAGVDPQARAEQLSLHQWAALASG